jgi:hypothetical protein
MKWAGTSGCAGRERFVQQHFYVGLVLKAFGFSLLPGKRNLAVAQADGDLARSCRQDLLRLLVQRSTVPVQLFGESVFRLKPAAGFFLHGCSFHFRRASCGLHRRPELAQLRTAQQHERRDGLRYADPNRIRAPRST